MKNKLIIICSLIMPQISAENILLLTLPKSGTNLVLKLLKKISGKNNLINANSLSYLNIEDLNDCICWGHEWTHALDVDYTLEPNYEKIEILKKFNIKLILLIRDPREHIVSLLRAINKPIDYFNLNWGLLHFTKALYKATDTECFLKYQDINEIYKNYLQWKTDYPHVYVTYFEKLVGPKGGGNEKIQLQEIKNICKFLNININDSEIQKIASELFGNSNTFKEGKIDSWKKYYSKDNKSWYKHRAGKLLASLGYEKTNNW